MVDNSINNRTRAETDFEVKPFQEPTAEHEAVGKMGGRSITSRFMNTDLGKFISKIARRILQALSQNKTNPTKLEISKQETVESKDPHHTVTKLDIPKVGSKDAFEKVEEQPALKVKFREFLKKELSAENLDYIDLLKQGETLMDDGSIKDISKFIDDLEEKLDSINIHESIITDTKEIISEFKAELKKGSPDLTEHKKKLKGQMSTVASEIRQMLQEPLNRFLLSCESKV